MRIKQNNVDIMLVLTDARFSNFRNVRLVEILNDWQQFENIQNDHLF